MKAAFFDRTRVDFATQKGDIHEITLNCQSIIIFIEVKLNLHRVNFIEFPQMKY